MNINELKHEGVNHPLGQWLWDTGLFDDDRAESLYIIVEAIMDEQFKQGVEIGNQLGLKGIQATTKTLQDNK